MKKILSVFLILISILIASSGIDQLLNEVKQHENEIKKIERNEKKVMQRIEKIGKRTDLISRKRLEVHLNDLNKIQHQKNQVSRKKESVLNKLKPFVLEQLEAEEIQMMEYFQRSERERIIDTFQKYLKLREIVNFYFSEKIDIMINMDEPEEIKNIKIKLIREKIDGSEKEKIKMETIVNEFKSQIDFFKEIEFSGSGDDFSREYIYFLQKNISVLEKELNHIKNNIDLLKLNIRQIGGYDEKN